MNYSLEPVKWGDVTAFNVTVTMAWALSWGIWVNPDVRHPWVLQSGCGQDSVSKLSRNSAWMESLCWWQSSSLVLGLSVCALTLWINDYYLENPGAPCWLPDGRAAGCSSCSNLFVLWDGPTADDKAAEGLCGLLTLQGTVALQLPLGSEACLFVKNKICLSVTLFERILQSSK